MSSFTDRTTVVVICHNYGRFLREAVESVWGQTSRPRLLVMDDASQDETPGVVAGLLAEQPDAFVYHRSDVNLGLARTRNQAAQTAETEWIVYLDADDWLADDFVEAGERWLADHRHVDALTTDMFLVRDGRRLQRRKAQPPRRWTDLLRANSIVQTSFIRRSLVLELGGYDPSLDFEDWDFWIRAVKAGHVIGRLPGPHVFRREHGANKSKQCDEARATAAIRSRHPPGPA